MWSKKDETSVEEVIQLIKKLRVEYPKKEYDITFSGDREGYLLVTIYKKGTEENISEGYPENYLD